MVVNFKVFKKVSPNGKITVYLGKRDFVDHISAVEPIGIYTMGRIKSRIKKTTQLFLFQSQMALSYWTTNMFVKSENCSDKLCAASVTVVKRTK